MEHRCRRTSHWLELGAIVCRLGLLESFSLLSLAIFDFASLVSGPFHRSRFAVLDFSSLSFSLSLLTLALHTAYTTTFSRSNLNRPSPHFPVNVVQQRYLPLTFYLTGNLLSRETTKSVGPLSPFVDLPNQ
ncbi:hypothetical protein F5Y07DRAFT_312520 [Xylaria sp. FL0933]|nr:hypothetical protein F5Y07DRAFT_312520 [Xylaria sp. FL0933]